MKKIIALVLVFILCLSLAACSGTYINENGETITVKDDDVVLDVSDEFVITKMDYSVQYSKVTTSQNHYTIVAKSDKYAVLVNVEAEHYTLWEVGDRISGHLVASYESDYDKVIANITINETKYPVQWYGAIK